MWYEINTQTEQETLFSKFQTSFFCFKQIIVGKAQNIFKLYYEFRFTTKNSAARKSYETKYLGKV